MRTPRTTRPLFAALALWLAVSGAPATAQPASVEAQPAELGSDLIVRRLARGVWLHVSFKVVDEVRIPANGLIVTTGRMSLMIDTGWQASQTERLLSWAQSTLGQPVEHLIVTHAHEDRMGGLAAAAERPIIVHGHAATAEIVAARGEGEFHWSFEFEERLNLGGETLHLFYPGPAHAPDNIVVWLPERRLLFGGCLIKSLPADGLGYVADADLKTWPSSVRRVIERYREAEILVPGHGPPGNARLLSHTMELLERAAAP